MVACWDQLPEKRLSAEQAVQRLRELPGLSVDDRPPDNYKMLPLSRSIYKQDQHPFAILGSVFMGDLQGPTPEKASHNVDVVSRRLVREGKRKATSPQIVAAPLSYNEIKSLESGVDGNDHRDSPKKRPRLSRQATIGSHFISSPQRSPLGQTSHNLSTNLDSRGHFGPAKPYSKKRSNFHQLPLSSDIMILKSSYSSGNREGSDHRMSKVPDVRRGSLRGSTYGLPFSSQRRQLGTQERLGINDGRTSASPVHGPPFEQVVHTKSGERTLDTYSVEPEGPSEYYLGNGACDWIRPVQSTFVPRYMENQSNYELYGSSSLGTRLGGQGYDGWLSSYPLY